MADTELTGLTAATSVGDADLFLTRQDAALEDRKINAAAIKTYAQNGVFLTASDSSDDITEGVSNLFYSDERVDDRVSSLLVGGTNITLSYDDNAGTLTIDGAALPVVPIDTVFGRTGNVVAMQGDYSADQIDYDNTISSLTATDVKTALDEISAAQTSFFNVAAQTTDHITEGGANLFYSDERVDDRVSSLLVGGTNITLSYDDNAGILTINGAALPVVPIDTVFGRTGNIVAAQGDYSADQIDYDNLVSGLSAADVKAALDELAAMKANKKLSLNEQSGTAYTFVLSDAESYVRLNNAATITATVPNNSAVSYDIGTVITARQVGAGQVVIAADSGVTIHTPQTLKLSGAGAVVSLVKVSTNTWDLFGDLELAP